MALQVELIGVRRQANGSIVGEYRVTDGDLLERRPTIIAASGKDVSELAQNLREKINAIRPSINERMTLVELGRAAARKAMEEK